MRNFTLHKFLAMLMMTVSCATLSVAQNVAQKVAKTGGKEYATLQAAADAALTAGQTVTLINDVDLTTGSNLEVHKWLDMVLDMNGHSIKGANADHKNICVSGKLTLKDSKENSTGKIYAETPDQDGVYGKPLVEVNNDGQFVMESGHINSVPAGNSQTAIGAYYNSKVIINGGTIESGWYAINGSIDEDQNTTITINGGTLVSTSSYAISHPQSGTLTINSGAVVYGAGGAIDMKRGNLVVNGGIMTSKGKGDTGKWGEGTGDPGKAALNFCAPYGNVTATIKGGTITAAGDAVLTDDQPTEGKTVTLAIEGGKYSSSDVSKYCSSGYTATPNADGTYTVSYFGNVVLVVYDYKSKEIAEAGQSIAIDMDQVNKIWVPEAGVKGVNTTLTKNYTNTGWNAFFVPFDFTLTDEMLNDFEFATLYAIALENGNGSSVISYIKKKAGDKIVAFFPCLIKAKATGEQTLNVGEVDYKSNVTPTDCSSTTELYTFHPVMENTYIAAKHGYYLKSEQNSFVYNIHPKAYIQPLRYYMTIQDKGDMSYIVPANGGASKAKIYVIGEDEPTGITDLVDEAASASGKIYNLQGVVVGNTTEGLPKGVYIKNGRKIIVK